MPRFEQYKKGEPDMPPEMRFWSYVEIGEPNECWFWHGGVSSGTGYGNFWTGHRQSGAHVFAYLLEYGAITRGYRVDHKCRTRLCVNPFHLEEVTNTENIRRIDPHYRRFLAGDPNNRCPRGHLLFMVGVDPDTYACRACVDDGLVSALPGAEPLPF